MFILILAIIITSYIAPLSTLSIISYKINESVQKIIGGSMGTSLDLEMFIIEADIGNRSRETICLVTPLSNLSTPQPILPSKGTAIISRSLWSIYDSPKELVIGDKKLVLKVYNDASLPGVLSKCLVLNPEDIPRDSEYLGGARIFVRGRDTSSLINVLEQSIDKIMIFYERSINVLAILSSATLSIMVIRRVSKDLRIAVAQGGNPLIISIATISLLGLGVILATILSAPLTLTIEHMVMGTINILYGSMLAQPAIDTERLIEICFISFLGALISFIYLIILLRGR